MRNKRQSIGPPLPPPPAPSLRLSKLQFSQKHHEKSYTTDNLLNKVSKYTFGQPNGQLSAVFETIQNCGIAIPSIFGPITTLSEFHLKILKAYYHSIRILIFYHYRKGGSLDSIIKHRDNLIIVEPNIKAQALIWQFVKTGNVTNKWHLVYHENKLQNKKLVIFRDIRTHILNDNSKYLMSLLNISTNTAIQLLTMLIYKTLSCSENSFLKLVKTLLSSLSNYYLSLLCQLATEIIKRGNLQIEMMQRVADRWLPIFISQETPYSEQFFVQLILSSPDQLPHLSHLNISGDNCSVCSNSLLFLLSLIRTSRQFLSILAKYPQASKTAFSLFVSLAKDERFGDSNLMLRAEATNAIVQLWLSPAKTHILTLGPNIIQTLGEICRLQTIQINVWKPLLEDCIDKSDIKLLDYMIGNTNHFDELKIYNELDSIDCSLPIDQLYILFSKKFLRPYCISQLDQVDTNYYLAPLIINYLINKKHAQNNIQGIYGILVKLLIEMSTKSPLTYLYSARLSLFIPWLSLHRSKFLQIGINCSLLDDLEVEILQNGEISCKFPNNHIYNLGGSKHLFMTFPDIGDDRPQLSVSKILFDIMELDNKQGTALLDFLSQLAIHYYPLVNLTHLSLILSLYYEMNREMITSDTLSFVNDGKKFQFNKNNIVSVICMGLGVKNILVTLKGLTNFSNEVNKPLEYIFSKIFPISPNVRVTVNMQYETNNKSKLDGFLKLGLRHLLEYYIDRHINIKFYKHSHSINVGLSDLTYKSGIEANDESIGTITQQLCDRIKEIKVQADGVDGISSFLSVFCDKITKSITDLSSEDTNCDASVGFYEYISKISGKFNEIDFDSLASVSNQYGRIGELIISHFIANILARHVFGDKNDAFIRFTHNLSNNKYTLSQVINCLKNNSNKMVNNELLPFLMNESEFKNLVDDHTIVTLVKISPFNILTNNLLTTNHGRPTGLVKWQCDWLLVCAKITSSMSFLGCSKAGAILEKIEKQFHGSLLNKISVNDKRELRISTLLPYKQVELALDKIAEFLQVTNNVEYASIALDTMWSLVISSLPRVDLVGPLLKILLTVNSQMSNPHIMNLQAKNLNLIASLVTTTLLLWITADPLQSLITFSIVTPSKSTSSVIVWKNIENFVKFVWGDKNGIKFKFNGVNLQFAEFTLPLAHKIFMG